MFAAFSVVVPVPACVKEPVPEIALEVKSVPCVTALLRLIVKLALSVIAPPLLGSEPLVPPFPSCSVPPARSIGRPIVLVLVKISVPVPNLWKELLLLVPPLSTSAQGDGAGTTNSRIAMGYDVPTITSRRSAAVD